MAPGGPFCRECGRPLGAGAGASAAAACPSCAETVPPRGAARPVPRAFRLPPPGTDLGGIAIEGPLGSGGMGSLLLGRDAALGRRVAVKFLREGVVRDGRTLARFRREGRALARVRHPHVVPVYSQGEWDGWPFLVMEYVEGEPLAALLRRGPLPVPEVLRVAEELASAVAALHERRIVHRDLNPSNCILRSGDRSVCLVDFGLARELDRDSATSSLGAGTPLYMAPEQALGRAQDERADVYSFGVTLFEMATGTVPFEGLDRAAFLRAVALEDAPLLRTRAPGAPRGLEVLVARCLSRAPEFRPPGGEALLEQVRDVRAGRSLETGPEAAAGDAPPPPEEGEEHPLLGRDEEYRAALEALADAPAGRGRLLLVEGAAGAGKSRFLREVARAARARALAVFPCEGAEFAGAPYQPVRALLREQGRAAGAGTTAGLVRILRDAVPGGEVLEGALRAFLEPGAGGGADPPARTTLEHALLALLRSLLRERPAVLLAEDVHRMDQGSLEFLAAAAREARGWPLAILASFRPQGDPQRPETFAPMLAKLEGVPGASTLRLGPLPEGAVAALLRRVLGLSEPESIRLAPSLHRKSGGNALYLAEGLRYLREAGEREGGRDVHARITHLTIPPRVLEIALQRIQGLPLHERDALGVASVDPEGVPSALVERCLGLPRLEALRLLQHLVRERGILALRGEAYAIPHGEVRQAVYADLLPELRSGYHAEAAAALLAEGAEGADPGRVGRHLARGGKPAAALPHLLAAGGRFRRHFSPSLAREYFEEALQCAGPGGSVAASVGVAACLDDLGDPAGAERAYRAGAAGGDPEGVLALVAFLKRRSRHDEARALLAGVRKEGLPPSRLAEYLRTLCQLESAAGRFTEALRAVEESLPLEPLLSEAEVLQEWANRGTVYWRTGRAAEAAEVWERALDLAGRIGNLDRRAVVLVNLPLVYEDLGDHGKALEKAREAASVAAAMGDDPLLAHATQVLASNLIDMLELDEAVRVLDAGREVLGRIDMPDQRLYAIARRADVAFARGEPREALRLAMQGREASGARPHLLPDFRLCVARALLALGKAGEALDEAREARAAFEARGQGKDAEECAAAAARALRALGKDGPEREAMRRLDEPLSVPGAVEAAREAPDGAARERRAAAARRLATSPLARREVEEGLRQGGGDVPK